MGEGWTADAEFTWPKTGEGPFPTVILFHGGCSCGSMDGAYWENPGDPIQERNFRLLASELGKQGIAVMRFNRRGAINDRETDAAQEGAFFSDPFRAAADGEAVLSATKAQAEADPTRIFLYGWSYGSTVATMIAPYHADLKGLILQGAPAEPTSFDQYSYLPLQTVTPYLARVADKNQDGKLSGAEINGLNLRQGPVWWVTSGLFDASSTPDKPVFASGLDANNDGLVDIKTELIPFLTAQAQAGIQSAPNRDASTLVQILGQIQMPVLILDGESDGLIQSGEFPGIGAGRRVTRDAQALPWLGSRAQQDQRASAGHFRPDGTAADQRHRRLDSGTEVGNYNRQTADPPIARSIAGYSTMC